MKFHSWNNERVSDMEAITKKCTKCGEVKSLSAFSKDKGKKDGLFTQCNECRKAYRKANAEKIKEYDKAYRKANADRMSERNKAYYKANAEKIAERCKAYRKANADKKSEWSKLYSENLTGGYVANLIRLPIADIPPEFIELKRTQLKINRLIKQKQNQTS